METTVLEKDNRRLVYADNRVIGEILDGRFIQRINRRHLLRSLNSKGIEIDVYETISHSPKKRDASHYFCQGGTMTLIGSPEPGVMEVTQYGGKGVLDLRRMDDGTTKG